MAIQRISVNKTNHTIRWIVLSSLWTTGARALPLRNFGKYSTCCASVRSLLPRRVQTGSLKKGKSAGLPPNWVGVMPLSSCAFHMAATWSLGVFCSWLVSQTVSCLNWRSENLYSIGVDCWGPVMLPFVSPCGKVTVRRHWLVPTSSACI